MQIVFGWHLDGPTCPETPAGGASAIDARVVGPSGLLGLLETRLGRNGPGTPAVVRIAQYLARLRALDDGQRFFSRSLTADGWATARLLLLWRDELVAAGWSPGAVPWASDRIADVALVEKYGEPLLAPGPAERAYSLLPHLHGACPIDDLTIVDDPQRLPLVWRRLIEALAAGGAKVVPAAVRPGAETTDLAKAQALLCNGKSGKELKGDRSFSVVRCDDELTAGTIAAEWLAAAPEANAEVAIVRRGDAMILDGACRRLGLPKPGGITRSPLRGALQALPLAFATAWRPLDAKRLLELLVMPGSPVPHRIGRHFANVLRDYPGIGGLRWQQAWQRAEEALREQHSGDELKASELAAIVRKSLARWREWLLPEGFDRESGMCAAAADAICGKVQHWARRRASASGNAIYPYAANAAAALAKTIAASGLDPIPKPQLDRMIDAVLAEGTARSGSGAEAAPWIGVDNPAQIWGGVPSVLWWGFSDSGTTPPRPPWGAAERAELAAAGARPNAPEAVIALHLDAQRRAILNATERVLLIAPSMAAADAAPHPLWHELATLDGLDRCIIDGRALRGAAQVPLADDSGSEVGSGSRRSPCGSAQVSLGGRVWAVAPAAPKRIPRPIRNWQVPEQRIGPRPSESATSLETLLGCPLNWVLRYHVGLRESGLLDMADGNRLKGNIAHEVLARFLVGPLPDNAADMGGAVAALLDAMLPEIASPLLLPGRVGDREEVRRNTVESAVALVGILADSGLSVAATERRLQCRLDDGTEIEGVVDLELSAGDARPAVVDLKWSNSDRYRRAEIAEARPVQLATYTRLLQGDKGEPADALPAAAYFMLKQGRLLAVDAAPFPEQFQIGGSELASVWDAILAVRRRTLGELAAGSVVATGVEPDDAHSQAPEPAPAEERIVVAPPCRFCAYGRLCGQRALA